MPAPYFNFQTAAPADARPPPCAAHGSVVDPHHFVLFQHGILGSAGDFTSVIEDLVAEHDVTLQEAWESLLHFTSPLPSSFGSPTSSGASASASASSDARAARRRRARLDAYKANNLRLTRESPNGGKGHRYRAGNLVCFSPGSNNYFGADAGVITCATRMLAETVPVMEQWLDEVERKAREAECDDSDYSGEDGASRDGAAQANSTGSSSSSQPPSSRHRRSSPGGEDDYVPICFSCVAHSFGGIIIREFIYRLAVDTTELSQTDPVLYASVVALRQRMMRMRVTFENYVTLASPHCGTTECLWWPLRVGAWWLATLQYSKSFGELIVSDAEKLFATRMVDGAHIAALKLFRRRTLFANSHRDLLVGFGTSALIYENVPDDHTKVKGYWWDSKAAPCASAFDSDTAEVSAVIYMPAHHQTGDERSSDGKTTACPPVPPLLSPRGRESHTRRSRHRSHRHQERGEAAEDRPSPLLAHEAGAPGPSHTLYDLWEFRHTCRTTTLSPLHTPYIYTVAPSRVARLKARAVALAQRAVKAVASWSAAPPAAPLPPSMTVTADAVALSGPADGVCAESACAASDEEADWYHYDRYFPLTPSTASGRPRSEKEAAAALALCDGSPFELSATGCSAADAAGMGAVEDARPVIVASPLVEAAEEFHIARVIPVEEVRAKTQRVSPLLLRSPGACADEFSGTSALRRLWTCPHPQPLAAVSSSAAARCPRDARLRSPAAGESAGAMTESAPALVRAALLPVSLPLAVLRWTWRVLADRLRGSAAPCANAESAPQGGGRCVIGPTTTATSAGTSAAGARSDSGSSAEDEANESALSATADAAEEMYDLYRAYAQTLPPARLTPRAIAHELRRELDWRVRAVRITRMVPTAHVVCIGTFSWLGFSPDVLRVVAQEIAHVL